MKTKRFFSMILAALMLLCLFAPSIPALAEGTQAVPMVPHHGLNGKFLLPIEPPAEGSIAIATKEELKKLGNDAAYPLTANYHLTADIDLGGEEWVPVASFEGIFDGQGHAVKNLTMTELAIDPATGNFYAGLFAALSSAGGIKNLGLEDTNIDVKDTPASDAKPIDAGGICALNDGTISNCYSTGAMSLSLENSSGSHPLFSKEINYFAGAINNATKVNVGGICAQSGSINNCYNTATISTSCFFQDFSGGICGYNKNGTIVNCYNAGEVTHVSLTNSGVAGGICGEASGSTISNCYNTSAVTQWFAGGICGNAKESTIENCYNAGAVTAEHNKGVLGQGASTGSAGGICERTEESTISNCYWNIDSEQTNNGVPLSNSEKRGIAQLYGGATDTTTPLTSEEMTNAASFADFDFDEVWAMSGVGDYKYPVFKEQAAYTITYNANGGSSAPAPQIKYHGISLTIPAAVPQRTGYTFLGWAEKNTDDEAKYLPSGSYAQEGNATLYAVWSPDEYQYRFFDGVNASPRTHVNWTDKEFFLNNVLEFASPPIARAGCELLGWSLTPGAAVPDYLPNGTICINSAADFHAVWAFRQQTATGNVSVTPASAFAAGTEMKASIIGNNIWLGESGTVVKYNITFFNGSQTNLQPNGAVTVRLEIPQAYLDGGGNLANLIVTYKGEPIAGAKAVQTGGKWYMEFQTDHFSEYVIECRVTPPAPVLKWWQKLAAWLQWILRWFCFGWIWMK